MWCTAEPLSRSHSLQLRQAKLFFPCVHLIVGVVSSQSCAQHKNEPVLSSAERYASVRNCRWVDEVLPRWDSFDTEARAELAWVVAVTASEVGDEEDVRAAHARLTPLLDEIDDPYLSAVALIGVLWTDPVLDGEFDAPLRIAEASVERFRELQEPTWLVLSLCSLAEGKLGIARFDEAGDLVDEASRLADVGLYGPSGQMLPKLVERL